MKQLRHFNNAGGVSYKSVGFRFIHIPQSTPVSNWTRGWGSFRQRRAIALSLFSPRLYKAISQSSLWPCHLARRGTKCGIVTTVQRRKTMKRRKRFRDDHQWWPRTPTTGVIGRRNNYHSCEFNVWKLLQHSHCMNERVKTAATEKPPHTNLELQARRRAMNVKLWMNEWMNE